MTYRQLLYVGALSVPLVAGCASIALEEKVRALEEKPYAERIVMVKKGQGLDELYGLLRGQILPQYQDPNARKAAENKANAVVIIPTGQKDVYYALMVEDADQDGLYSKGDFKFVDVVDGKQVEQFVLDKKNLPELLRWQLINQGSAKPFAPPVQKRQESKKPFIRRRETMYVKPQVGYRARSKI